MPSWAMSGNARRGFPVSGGGEVGSAPSDPIFTGGGAHMIEVRNLTKRYRDLVAIEDVSFDVGKGEILGFLGRNGAGKTTTMRILTGFLPATSGTARVAGFDVATDSMDVRRHIGYL